MERPRSRREDYSDATKQALLDSAHALFVEKGYARASLDEITAAARVTKGALYHHFDGKQSLFEAVLVQVEESSHARILAAFGAHDDPWEGALAALDGFVDEVSDTEYGRLVFVEGPVALGWARWREYEEKYGYGLTEGLLQVLMDAGYLDVAPVPTMATLAFGMLGHAGLALAEAPPDDRDRLKDEVRTAIRRIFEGVRVTPPKGRRPKAK